VDVAKEFGVTESSVSRWVQQYRKTHLAGEPIAETINADKRVQELEKELREVKAERDFLKKCAAFFARDHR
jgi:transposase